MTDPAPLSPLDQALATAILGVDTLFGGDVMNPSGMGRFIADSWIADLPLPEAYTHPLAAKMRESGGVSAKEPDKAGIGTYVEETNLRGAIATIRDAAAKAPGLHGEYLAGEAFCLEVMLDLALEVAGIGEPVPYERCVIGSTGKPPEPSDPRTKRAQVAELLKGQGFATGSDEALLASVDAWRAERLVPKKSIKAIADAVIAELDALVRKNLMPYVPAELAEVPRANITFLPIENAWFSGSMNYLGRARNADGSPQYEATYEINAALEISYPEFQQLVSHEVVPGHVTTFAWIQNLFVRGKCGFEGTVQTMNTRSAALSEGIANNAILIAHGIKEIDELPDLDLRIGCLLALLQDDGKNQSSYLTWKERRPQAEVAATIRRDFLLSPERADKLSGAWGRHPLLGRMYLPAYRAGTELVAELRRKYAPEKILPALYGVNGLADVVTVERAARLG
jgi:hypothetical protein